MSKDYIEKERAFLEALKDDTGRDLQEWLEAIRGSGHSERNDIIDWLRQQGFMFSKASWLERIHHNGGKPIYADPASIGVPAASRLAKQLQTLVASPPARAEAPVATAAASAHPRPEPDVAAPAPAPAAATAVPAAPRLVMVQAAPAIAPAPAPTASAVAAETDPALDPLLAACKAYRPLAQLVLKEIIRAVPGVSLAADGPHIAIGNPRLFGLLALSARELRLLLADPGGETVATGLKPARLWPPALRGPEGLTHMLVLTDARQVDEGLLQIVRQAASRHG